MKDLTHYFGQSPKGDDSPTSLKENDDTASEIKPVENCINGTKNVEVLKQSSSNSLIPSIGETVPAVKTPKSRKSKHAKSNCKKSLSTKARSSKEDVDEVTGGETNGNCSINEHEELGSKTPHSVSKSNLKKKPLTNGTKTKVHFNLTAKTNKEQNSTISNDTEYISTGESEVSSSSEQLQSPKTIKQFFCSPKSKSCNQRSVPGEGKVQSTDVTGESPTSSITSDKLKGSLIQVKKKANIKQGSTQKKTKVKAKGSRVKDSSGTPPTKLPLEQVTNNTAKQETQLFTPVQSAVSCAKVVKSAKEKLSLSKGMHKVAHGDESELTRTSGVCEAVSGKANTPFGMNVTINNALKRIMTKDVKCKSSEALNRICLEKPAIHGFETRSPSPQKLERNSSIPRICSNSPIKLRKSKIQRNCIESDSEDEVHLVSENIDVQNVANGRSHDCSASGIAEPNQVLSPKADESRRNSLMKYFTKVSKEEALAKTEKVELKVEVMVHSPPTTPSKKEKRRSTTVGSRSIPSAVKKKSKSVKSKLKVNIDAIDIIGVEEISSTDKKSDSLHDEVAVVQEKELHSRSSTGKSLSTKKSLKKTKSVPHELCQSETKTALDSNAAIKNESMKEMSPSRKKTQPFKSVKYSSRIQEKVKSASAEEKGLEIIEICSKTTPEKVDERKTPNQSWKMRVSLTQHVLPSTRGTMEEVVSDCEEIFFTSNKKKRKVEKDCITKAEIKKGSKGKKPPQQIDEEATSPDIIFELEKPVDENKSGVKLAPLFGLKEKAKARQQFLLSGVPEQVKKVVEMQHMFEEQEAELFPSISHIQQKTMEDDIWNLPSVQLPLKPDPVDESFEALSAVCKTGLIKDCAAESEELKQILSVSCEGPRLHIRQEFSTSVIKPILRLIRKEAPDFKVVNTFTVLREKVRQERQAAAAADRARATAAVAAARKGRRRSSSIRQSQDPKDAAIVHPAFRCQIWTEKYKPISASEIIGNEECVLSLKRWLEAWRKVSEEARKQCRREETSKGKRKKKRDDYDEDFVVSGDSSDGDRSNLPMNPAVLFGQSGCGKTCSVYALANDYGYKVLEVNASEKRNGKIILSKLSEATQSHQVQRSNSAEQGFAALFGVKAPQQSTPKSKKPKLEVCEDSDDKEDEKSEKMSLILIDDVDIVFEEEDEGFISALANLISTSKRPVVLTTADPESPFIARFFNSSSLVLYFTPCQESLCIWLQLVCLLEGVYAAPAAVKALVSLCGGDVRRALLQMQLWVTTGGNNLPMPCLPVTVPPKSSRKRKKGVDQCELDVVDDLSCISLDDDPGECSDNTVPLIKPNPDCIGAMLGRNDEIGLQPGDTNLPCKGHLIASYPVNTGLLWWNLAPMLGLPQISHEPLPLVKEYTQSIGVPKLLSDSFVTAFCSDEENSNGPTSEEIFVGGAIEDLPSLHESETEANNSDKTSVLEEKYNSYISYCRQEDMTAMMRQMVSLSVIDMISSFSRLPETVDCDEPVSRLWQKPAKNSLLLSKPVVMGPNCTLESTARGLTHWLGEETLSETRHCLKSVCYEKEAEPSFTAFDPCLPSFEERRWRRAHADCEEAVLEAVPLCVQLDRRAVSTDYMSTIQTVCRLEHQRSVVNTKRRNRFYHYLKGMGLHLTENQLELFCQSMSRTS